jgi:hypothetical protein
MKCHTYTFFLFGCLSIPPAPPLPDRPDDPDAGMPGPPQILALSAHDSRGDEWPLDAIARTSRIRVAISERAEEPPIWIFRGPADAELIDDLSSSPLRAAHADRAIPTRIEETPLGWTLFPERLAPGEVITVGVGAWLRGATTDLAMGIPFAQELVVSGAPDAGAQATASWPADGSASVPASIPELAVRFDGSIEGVGRGVAITLDGAPIDAIARLEDCTTLGWDDGACAAIVPNEPLEIGRTYELRVGDELIDETGAPVGPWSARFATGEDDGVAPALLSLECALDEVELGGACALIDDAGIDLRIVAAEPVRTSLAIDGTVVRAIAPRGTAMLRARPLVPSRTYSALLHLTDLAGRSHDVPLELTTSEPLATISIVEVCADPSGPEPRQEYVEVLNYGDTPVDLAGFSITDDATVAGDVLPSPSLRLAPGQRALIVSDDFDPIGVPPGVPLARVSGSLGSGGLANSGEPLFLRDPMTRRISAVPAMAAVGACVVRTGDDPRSAGSRFEIGPCTPGIEP